MTEKQIAKELKQIAALQSGIRKAENAYRKAAQQLLHKIAPKNLKPGVRLVLPGNVPFGVVADTPRFHPTYGWEVPVRLQRPKKKAWSVRQGSTFVPARVFYKMDLVATC